MNNAGYGAFALYYDSLTQNIDYDKIADYYLSLFEKQGVKQGNLLDLACGTGNLTVKLCEKSHFDLTAADISTDMLSMASAKQLNNTRLLLSDMCSLYFNNEFDAVICGLDSLNHLSNASELNKAFCGVFNSLKKGGIFAFDMNSVKKHREVLGDNTFVYDVEGVFCAWQNEYFEENNRVDIMLDLFVEKRGKYIRHQESFSETAYPIKLVEELLIKSGFEILNCYDYLTEKEASEDNEKFVFLARKV